MPRLNSFLGAVALILAVAPAALAEDVRRPVPATEGDDGTVLRLFWEDDGSLPNLLFGHDRHYTNGLALAILGRPGWLEPVSESLPFWDPAGAAAGSRTGGGWVLGQLMFTPRDIGNPNPIPDDMAFAGYLYTGGFWQRETEVAGAPGVRVLEHAELDVGVIGPSSKGASLQTFVHDRLHFGTHPDGWRNQMSDEPTGQLYLRRKWCLDQAFFGVPPAGPWRWEAIPEATLALGTVYDHAEAGCTVRYGVNLPRDFGPPRLTDPGTPGCGAKGGSFYVYARTSARAAAYDSFTDGSMLHSGRTGGGSAIHGNRLRADGTLGLLLAQDWGRVRLELGYGLTFQTKQFREQRGRDSYGAFQLGVKMDL